MQALPPVLGVGIGALAMTQLVVPWEVHYGGDRLDLLAAMRSICLPLARIMVSAVPQATRR